MTITDLKQLCGFAPTVWTFRTFEDRPAYIRLRRERLQVVVGVPGTRCPWKSWRDEHWLVYTGGVNRLEWPAMVDGYEGPTEKDVCCFLTFLPDELPSYARHVSAEE